MSRENPSEETPSGEKPSRELPARPNLQHLRKQAKDLLRDFRKGDAAAMERLRAVTSDLPKLADARLAVAREYGLASWAKLKEHVEAVAPPIDPMEAMAAAFRALNVPRVRQLFAEHPELKAKINAPFPGGSFGQTALLLAVQWANRDLVDALLEAGADINARSHWWAGSFGVLDGDHGLAEFLIQRGAKVDAHAAARMGRLDTLRELLAADPSLVHARGGDGQTPLHFAANVEIARLLLDHGADMNTLDIDHESTPAQWMARERQSVAKFLVERGCKTDILLAAALGDLSRVRKHLDADPACIRTSVNAKCFPMRDSRAGGSIYIWTLGQNKSAHRVARDFGHAAVFDLLMERSPDGLKLAAACEMNDEAMVKSLLARQPSLAGELTEDELPRLAYAVQDNDLARVKLMLSAGWPVAARGLHNATPLHWGAWHGNAAIVRELLGHGAPFDIRGDAWNLTPLGWALHGSQNSWHRRTGEYGGVVEALLDAGANPPELKESDGNEAIREVLRRRGAK